MDSKIVEVTEVWADTGESVLRKFTDEEAAQRLKDTQELLFDKTSKEEADTKKAEAKAALLERLGITADEAALLLG
jgi:hypothetical protein